MISVEDARPFYKDADSVHDFSHILRVLTLAERLATAEGADWRVVRTAILLHDISRGEDNAIGLAADGETDHAMLSARRARQLLPGEDSAFVEAVAHCIEAHRYRNNIAPQTIEAMVVFDADKLDAIGAVGIARAFAYGGFLQQPLWGEVSPGYTPDQPGEVHTAHHEYHVKLRAIKDQLYTKTGRQMAAARHDFMARFFDQMTAEVQGER